MGSSESTLLSSQSDDGITTVSERLEYVDPMLQKLRSLKIIFKFLGFLWLLAFGYSVPIVIRDETGTATVTMFDKPMKLMTGTDCSDMMYRDGYIDPNKIPQPIYNIRGQVKKFHVKVQHERYGGSTQLKCNCVSDPDITWTKEITTPGPSTSSFIEKPTHAPDTLSVLLESTSGAKHALLHEPVESAPKKTHSED